ncbi:unnamed protein product [Paramecium sonneborni]|uniref:Uncharacterized protein n=1 Tax=Paramecium sonneborni TaxID=65129 RepID=A0A8S1NQY3_9CILI|nr:unnamed protein product [Paramecium sonneborni]
MRIREILQKAKQKFKYTDYFTLSSQPIFYKKNKMHFFQNKQHIIANKLGLQVMNPLISDKLKLECQHFLMVGNLQFFKLGIFLILQKSELIDRETGQFNLNFKTKSDIFNSYSNSILGTLIILQQYSILNTQRKIVNVCLKFSQTSIDGFIYREMYL